MANIPLTQIVAAIGDPDGTRTVTSIVVLLVAMGLALIVLAVWIYRTTRPDPELLAPLEVMGERSWRRGDPVWQRRRLDELRPEGAHPLMPSAAPPELDASFDAGPSASGFDDLTSSVLPLPADTPFEPRVVANPEVPENRERNPTDETDGDGSDEPSESAETGAEQSQPIPVDSTPPGVIGPTFDVFLDDDFDQAALAAAREQLERELADSSRSRTPDGQLGGSDRDDDG